MTNIIWFRNDLRLSDNPALFYGAQNADILPIYIMEPSLGAAAKIALFGALQNLQKKLNGRLAILHGQPLALLQNLVQQYDIQQIHCNLRLDKGYEQDEYIKKALPIPIFMHNGSFLHKPWQQLKNDGTPYKIFTAFYKKLAPELDFMRPLYASDGALHVIDHNLPTLINRQDFLPAHPWHKPILAYWQRGEGAAQARLADFTENHLHNYAEGRDRMDKTDLSFLSSYLSFGEISPHQIIEAAQGHEQSPAFIRQVIWREFAHYTLFHFPKMENENLRPAFDHYPWDENSPLFERFKKGQTGYSIIDAAISELRQTGFMHNRARMIVASFLIKNLNIHWRSGKAFFDDFLIDANPANNAMGWQWVAGSGIDSAPYFRIFNPITQGKKFDPKGEYIKKYLPHLKNIPAKYIHEIWLTPQDILQKATITLGIDYPYPLVDLSQSRQQALANYKAIKGLS